MTDYEIILILQDLSRSKFSCKYSDLQYNMAIEYAINKIRAYNDLSRMHKALATEFSDYVEMKKHEIPLRDNY